MLDKLYEAFGYDPSEMAARQQIAMRLEATKNKAVSSKRDTEVRWLRDERQYWGVQYWGSTTKDPDSAIGGGEDEKDWQISDNKTRQKTKTIAARVGDMMFPTNEKNWALNTSPVTTDVDGNPVDQAVAEDAANRAEDLIDDYLTECNYSKSGRKSIFDGCRIGTGVLKGPFANGTTRRVVRRRWEPVVDEFGQPMIGEDGQPMQQPAGTEIQVVIETKPAAARVDPWMWFPIPARNVDECEGSFEMHLYTKERLRELARYPGFDEEAVRNLVKMKPKHGAERALLSQRRDLLRSNADTLENTYSVWEYHGPIDKDDLKAYGMEVSDDPLESYFGEVWFCQGEVMKVELSPFMGDTRIPYYVWNYEQDEADIFGYGVPYIMRHEQYVLDRTINAMDYNASLTSGPQTLEFKGKVTPADGKRELKGPKHWIADGKDIKDFKEAIQFHYIESSISNVMPLYELARQNADENTMLPLIAQGEATNTVPTASGMAMLMNASNIVQRMAAHNWDDNITIPMITRFFYWIVEYEEDDSIKVDLEVDARGASYLLVKDMQAQHGIMVMNMAAQDPELRAMLNTEDMYKDVVNFLDVPTDRWFKSDEERQQAQEAMSQQQQQEQQRGEQIFQAELQEKQAKAAKAQAEARNLMYPEQDQTAMIEFQREQIRAADAQAERETKMVIAQMERDATLAKAAAEQEIKLVDLQGRLETAEQDRLVKALIEQGRIEQQERKAQRDEFQRGIDAQLKLRQEAWNERQQQLKEQNMRRGFDSFG